MVLTAAQWQAIQDAADTLRQALDRAEQAPPGRYPEALGMLIANVQFALIKLDVWLGRESATVAEATATVVTG